MPKATNFDKNYRYIKENMNRNLRAGGGLLGFLEKDATVSIFILEFSVFNLIVILKTL
jgi:hypothetical protein